MTRSPFKNWFPQSRPRPGELHAFASFGLAVALFAQLVSVPASAQEQAPRRARSMQPTPQVGARKLERNAPAEDTLEPGERHLYQFTLKTAGLARLVVEQRGIDLSRSLSTEAGVVVAVVDDDESTKGSEEISFVAEAPGVFRLEVRAATDQPAGGGVCRQAGAGASRHST